MVSFIQTDKYKQRQAKIGKDRQRHTKTKPVNTGKDRHIKIPLYQEEEEVAVNMGEGSLLKLHCDASPYSRSQTEQDNNRITMHQKRF